MKCEKCGGNVQKIDGWRTECDSCGDKQTICEVFSRVVGYITPISGWNIGKRAELNDRRMFGNAINMPNQTKF